MSQKRYDVIIVGGGAAGLSLAHHLLHSPLCDCSMLLIDKEAMPHAERTWCFWANQPTCVDDIVWRSWRHLQMVSARGAVPLDLHAYRYNMIRRSDFDRHITAELADANAEVLRGSVERIDDDTVGAHVIVDGRAYTGEWVFDSRPRTPACSADQGPYVHLCQQFTGWEIETPIAAFTSPVATLLDFRRPRDVQGVHLSHERTASFFHVLPFSRHAALIDHVVITTAAAGPQEHERALFAYLNTMLGIRRYHIRREQHGVSPMTDQPFSRRGGRHVMTIGIPGGRIKPSTGYGFLRIQNDSAAIVRSLLREGHPFNVPASPRRYRFFDSVMLRIMAHHPEWIASIFSAMFTRQPADRVLRFLDEAAPRRENLLVLPTLPPRLFVESIRDAGALGRV